MNNSKERYIYYSCIALVVIAVIIMVTSIFPACFPDDSVNILNDMFTHNRWRDWHPVTYYLFLRICMIGFHNPYTVILVHGVVAVITHCMVLKHLFRYYNVKACIAYIVALFTLGLASFEYIIILFKDTPYSFGMLAFTVYIMNGMKDGWSRKSTLIVILIGIFTSMMRHGGWVSLSAGLLVLAIYYLFKKQKKYALTVIFVSFAICASFNIMRYSLIKMFDVEKNPAYVAYTVPLYMLASYTDHQGVMDDRIVSVMEELAPINEWKVRYNRDKYLADTVARDDVIVEDVDTEGMHFKLIKANAIYFVTEPIEYLKHFFTINNLVWSPVTPKDGYIAYMPSLASGPFVYRRYPDWSTQIRGFGSVVKRLYDHIKGRDWMMNVLYRGGCGLIITLVSFLSLMIKGKTEVALSYTPILIYVCLIMISIPQQDTRYVLPLIMSSCLTLTLLLVNHISRQEG